MTIILDMDGTIIDASFSIVRCLNEAFESMGYEPLDMDEAISLSGIPLDGILRARLSEEDLQEGKRRYKQIHSSTFRQDTSVFPGAREALERWREEGKSMAVFTLRKGDSARNILSAFDLLDFFEVVVGCDEAPMPKPAPDHVETAASFLNKDPVETIVIGDNSVDMMSGKSAGARTIGVLWGLGCESDLIKAGAWKIAQDWQDLTQYRGR